MFCISALRSSKQITSLSGEDCGSMTVSFSSSSLICLLILSPPSGSLDTSAYNSSLGNPSLSDYKESHDPSIQEAWVVTVLARVCDSRLILALISSGLSEFVLLGEYVRAVNRSSFGFNAWAALQSHENEMDSQVYRSHRTYSVSATHPHSLTHWRHSHMRIPCSTAWPWLEGCCTHKHQIIMAYSLEHACLAKEILQAQQTYASMCWRQQTPTCPAHHSHSM